MAHNTPLTNYTELRIRQNYSSGLWQPLPDYLGEFAVIPGEAEKVVFAVHKSLKHPGMVAFYDSIEKAEAERETVTKVGRFLRRARPELTEDEIRQLAERYQADQAPVSLTFARTPEDIAAVYVNGPRSCMKDFPEEEHPCRVYGAGDLAIAHMGTRNRVLCWPEKKVFGRVYGNTNADVEMLQAALIDAGFQFSPRKLSGARVLKIEVGRNSWVMPYLDNDMLVQDKGDHFVLHDCDGYSSNGTDGIFTLNKECETCNSEFMPNDDAQSMCDDCWNEHSCCEDCDELTHHDNMVYIESEDHHICEHCCNQQYTRCDHCHEYFRDGTLTEAEGRNFCDACEEDNVTICPECDTPFLMGSGQERCSIGCDNDYEARMAEEEACLAEEEARLAEEEAENEASS